MIHFVHPEVFLLGLVVIAVFRRRIAERALVAVLRVAVLLLALGVLAEPYVAGEQSGRDLILVIDRSHSVPESANARVDEVMRLASEHRKPGDRVGVVAFGRSAAVAIPPTEGFRPVPIDRDVDRDGTALAGALDVGLALIPPGRRGSVMLVTDGENTGADAAAAARIALGRGLRVDAVMLRRERALDSAVDEIAAPGEVGIGEPFRFSAWVRCERAITAPFRLLRDGKVISRGTRNFRAGLNRLVFRDRLIEPGVHDYAVDLEIRDDRVLENNRARAVVRATGRPRLLCVTPGGRQDRLTRSLAATGLGVVVAAPEQAPLTLDALDGFRAVVLENVAADDLPAGGMEAVRRWVRDLGGGLLMTGGRASFGPGGYHRSPIEQALPVSMEVRQEQRKFALAMAVALDRSGSMAAAAGAGQTKMDLANLGTVAAIEQLGRADHVAVIAVDSTPHVIVSARPADDLDAIKSQVLSIDSGGGGIYVGVALHECARQLVDAPQRNKHIVLFADAADAEEPTDYKTFVPKLVSAGVTVSVIGLGREADSDATLLEEIATLGKGRCFFAADATDLPRVFAQEAIQVARSSVVEEPTAIEPRPGIVGIGDLGLSAFPTIGGYAIAYLKDRAQLGLRTRDDQAAPALSFWQHGVGRSAAFLGEVDGSLSGELAAWPRYGDFFATVARWLAGSEADAAVFAAMRREGHDAVLTVEVERGRERKLANLRASVLGPDGNPRDVVMRRIGPRSLEARVPLSGDGVYRAAVRVGENEVLRVAPVTLPYSPEFEHRADPRWGEKTLTRLCDIADGRVDPPVDEWFAGPRESLGVTYLATLCAILALVLLLIEIAIRRLGLSLPSPTMARLPSLPRVRIPLPRRKRKKAKETAALDTASAPEPTMASLLERAKQRARKR